MVKKEHYTMEASAKERVAELVAAGIAAWYRREPSFSFMPWCVEYRVQDTKS